MKRERSLPTPSPFIRDPHVISLTKQKFDLWRSGWLIFVRIPEEKDHVNLLVRGNVKANEEDGCATDFQQDMELTGAWLGNTTIFVRTGSLESSAPFAVSMNASSSKEITPAGTDSLSTAGFSVRGQITHDEPERGPDARVVVILDLAEVVKKQHTAGRGKESRAMSDLSGGGRDAVKDTVGGWLRVDGCRNADHSPAHSPLVLLSVPSESMNGRFPRFAP